MPARRRRRIDRITDEVLDLARELIAAGNTMHRAAAALEIAHSTLYLRFRAKVGLGLPAALLALLVVDHERMRSTRPRITTPGSGGARA
jgi:hypothetical protein